MSTLPELSLIHLVYLNDHSKNTYKLSDSSHIEYFTTKQSAIDYAKMLYPDGFIIVPSNEYHFLPD